MSRERVVICTTLVAYAGDRLTICPTDDTKLAMKFAALIATMPSVCKLTGVVHASHSFPVYLRVTPRVLGIGDTFEVIRVVIERIVVHMVDNAALGDRAIVVFPDIPNETKPIDIIELAKKVAFLFAMAENQPKSKQQLQ